MNQRFLNPHPFILSFPKLHVYVSQGFLANLTSLTPTKVVLNPIPMCVCQGVGGKIVSYNNNNSQMPARCPTIKLNYDTIYPERASESTGQGLSPTRLLSTSNVNLKPRLLLVLLTDQLQIGGFHDPLLGLQMPTANPGCYLYG